MKERVHLWLLLAVMLMASPLLQAQLQVFTEGFESGIPATWSQDPTTVAVPWTVGSSGVNNLPPKKGNSYVGLSASSHQQPTRLITSLTDISSLTNPVVSFWSVQPAFGSGDFDTLKIYYRTSTTGAWQLTYVSTSAEMDWTFHQVSLEGITGGNVQIAFEYNDNSGRGIGLDDVSIGNEAVCTKPTNIAVYRLTHESAELMWNANEQSLSYSLKVSSTPMTDMSATADVIDETVYSKPYILTGLSASTTYYVYVKADCGDGDVSLWSNELSFTTSCAPVALPLSENFNSYGTSYSSFPSCWTRLMWFNGDWGTSTPEQKCTPYCNSYASATALHMYAAYSTSTSYTSPRMTKCLAVSPRLDVADIHNIQVTFQALMEGSSYRLHVGIMTDPTDLSTFEELVQIAPSSKNSYEEYILPFSGNSNGGKYVAFLVDAADNNESESIYIDDVVIEQIPSCPKPSLFRAKAVHDTSVSLEWMSTKTSNWNIKIDTVPMTDLSQPAGVINQSVSTNPVVVSGLTPETTYYAYVQSDCSADSLSSWSNVLVFTTSCASMSQLPYIETFEGEADKSFPTCWQSRITYSPFPYVIVDASQASRGSNSLKFAAEPGDPAYAITPAFHVNLNALKVSFDISLENVGRSGTFEVGVMSNPADTSTFELVKSFEPAVAKEYMSCEVYLNEVLTSGLDNYIAFRQRSNNANWYYWLDNVVIDSLPSCMPPKSIQTRELTSSSAILAWSSSLGESNWNVKVSTQYLSRPQTDPADVYSGSVAVDSLVLDRLNMGKTYYAYLQSDCGDTTSSWIAYEFETLCGDIVSLPYEESFNQYPSTGTPVPSCWTRYTSSGSLKPYVNMSSSDNHTATSQSGSLYFACTETDSIMYAALPKVAVPNVNFQDMQISFVYKGTSSGEGVIVGVMSDPNNISTFVPVDTFIASADYKPAYDVTFENYTGSGRYVAFMSMLGFKAGSYNTIYIDDIVLEQIPTCKMPVDVHMTDVNSQSVTLSWTARSNESSWEVALGLPGFNPDSCTTTQVVTTDSATFTGLTPSTLYQVYVRALCGGNDGMSNWSSVMSFSTNKTPATLPYTTSFEDANDNGQWDFVNGTQKNGWAISSAVSDASGNCLYVTNSATGATPPYTYSNSSASYSFAQRLIHFEPGAYRVQYDWKCNGESSYDLGRVVLVSSLTQLKAGESYGMNGTNNTLPKGWTSFDNGILNQKTSWQHQDLMVAVTQDGDYHLTLFWKNDGSGGTQPPFAIDNINIEKLECAPVVDFTIEASDSDINVSWGNYSNSSLWDVRVSTDTIAQSQLDTIKQIEYSDSVTTNSVVIPNLTESTRYYIYVRTHCSDGSLQQWSMVEARTECHSVSSLPYVEHFDSDGTGKNSFASCWTKVLNYNDYPYIASENHTPKGKGAMYFYTTSSSSTYNLIASPRIDADLMKNLVVSFYTYYTSASKTLEFGVMSNPTDASTFVAMDTIVVNEASTWEYQEIALKNYTGNGQYIAFRTGGGSSYNYIYVDDIRIVDNRPCTSPSGLSISRLTNTSVKVSWSSTNSAIYNIKLSSTPINPEKQSADLIDQEGATQDGFMNLTDLDPNTTYYFYVQSDCGDVKPSYWSDELKFTTLCNELTVPYAEDFIDYGVGEGVMPVCWSSLNDVIGNVTKDYTPHIIKGVFYGTDSMSLKLQSYYYGGTKTNPALDAVKTIVSLPKFASDLNVLSLQFNNYSSTAGSKLSIGVMSDVSDASSFQLVDTVELGDWQPSMVSFANYQGQPGYISFMIDGSSDHASISAYLDQIRVDSLTSCQAARSLSCRNVTENSAEIVWSPLLLTDTVWHIQVSEFDAGVNPQQLDTMSGFAVDTIVHGSSAVVFGLHKRTTYYYYIRPVCSDGTEGPRYGSSKSFRTECGSVSIPYIESFDTYGTTNGTMPECWLGGTTTSMTSKYPTISSTYKSSSPGSMYLYSTPATYTYAVLPEIDIDSLKRVELSFMGYKTTNSYNITIGVMSDPTDFSTFDSLSTIKLSTSSKWQELSYSFANYVGTDKYIAFVSDRRVDSATNGFYIDDVLVQLQPTCYRPSSIQISDVSNNSVSLSWPAASTDVMYDVAVIPAGSSLATAVLDSVTGYSFVKSGLQPSTAYEVYVRSNCGAGDVSAWRGPVLFNTLQIPATVPFVSPFDQGNDEWSFANGTESAKFYIGSAIAHSGTGSLYISADDGATNTYNISAMSTAYAYRLIHVEPGAYRLTYDWHSEGGESSCDYGRAYIAPKSAVFTAGTNVMSSTATTVPSGWMAVDNGIMNLTTGWQHVDELLFVDQANDVYLVFGWHNDGSMGVNSALAIDNVSVVEERCYAPLLTADIVLDHSASFTWILPADSAEVKVSSVSCPTSALDTMSCDVFDGVVYSHQVNLSNLAAQTDYYVYVRGFCESGDTTSWSSTSFRTGCDGIIISDSTSFSDNFDSYSTKADMECWVLYRDNDTSYPSLSSTYFSSPKGVDIYAGVGIKSYVATPRLTGMALNETRVRLKARHSSLANYLLIGVMSNPNDLSTFVAVDSIQCTSSNSWQQFDVSLSGYTGSGEYVAFVKPTSIAIDIYIDDVVVEKLPSCSAPGGLSAHGTDEQSTTISWNHLATDSLWQLRVYSKTANLDLSQPGTVLDTIIGVDSILLNSLQASTTYACAVRTICSGTDSSEWLNIHYFSTECGVASVPYAEDFAGPFVPNCWSKLTGLPSGPITVTSGGWNSFSDKGLQGPHAKLNIFGSGCKYWLVTPDINITSASLLSFDLALTKYNSSDPILSKQDQLDDKFAVVVSRDHGVTWDFANAVIWSNDQQGDYVYNDIATNGERVHVNLSDYMGDTIMIGFYGESTASGGDNDLHVGQIEINSAISVTKSDSTCQDYAYSGYGFDIAGSDLSVPGNHNFTQVTGGQGDADTVLILDLYVIPNTVFTINATICNGDTYTQYGFNQNATGTYHRNGTAANGCDSVTYLNLTVVGGQSVSTSTALICQNEAPYTWRNHSYSVSGVYYDTLVSKSGCDSILELDLTVAPVYNVTDQLNINDVDLPYQYLDTTFTTSTPIGASTYVLRRQTAAGCDSVVTVTVNVTNTHVGLTDLLSGKFDMYPNPASPDEWITVDAAVGSDDLNGMVIEVFNSIGACVKTLYPTSLPVQFSGFTASGVYMVRVTTGTGKVVWSKLVIR